MRDRQASTFLSLALHVTAAALLLTVTTNPGVVMRRPKTTDSTFLIAPYRAMPPAKDESHGGGGGGKNALLRASRGDLPKAAPRQFTPPTVVHENLEPKLIMEPTIVAAANAPLPILHIGQMGDPLAPPGPASDGRGTGGGIGDGKGTGVGPGKGVGYGPGEGYNTGGGSPAFGAGGPRGSVTPAALLSKVEPEYSDEARRAKVQGTVLLYLEVDSDGKPRNITVKQGLGLGLDEKAIDAVMRWKFRPGKQNGRPITTSAMIEVNFRLL